MTDPSREISILLICVLICVGIVGVMVHVFTNDTDWEIIRLLGTLYLYGLVSVLAIVAIHFIIKYW